MKMLLDECIPRRFKNSFPSHDCRTAVEAGFAGRSNGELLCLAEKADFDALITIDRGLEYQQNLTERKITVILIRARSSRLDDLLPHVPQILALLPSVQPGKLARVGE
jgi:hypothetical protein